WHHGIEHLAGWSRDGVIAGTAQYLKHDQRRHGRQGSQSPEPEQGERGQYCERQTHTEDANDTAGEKKLYDQSDYVHGKVDLRKERGLRAAIMKIVAHEACLLEVEERCGDREQQDEKADIGEIGRLEGMRNAGEDTTADRLSGRFLRARVEGFRQP